jgi:integrase
MKRGLNMAVKLTDRYVRALKPADTGYRVEWDSEVKGFGVRVTATGAKAFIFNYRVGGRQPRYTIGSFPDWPVEQAREKAKALRREVDDGRDPMAERQAERAAMTVAELCTRYLDEHVKVRNKPRTRLEVSRMVERIIRPKLGRLQVEAVDHDDVDRLHRELRGTPRQANHVVAVLSRMFSLAERWKDTSGKVLRPQNSNPCQHVERYQEVQRTRFPKQEELGRIGAVLDQAEVDKTVCSGVLNCIRFLALSGCRLSEAVELDLDAVDFRSGVWTLSDAKAGGRAMQLGAPALALLVGLGRASGRAFQHQDGTPITANMIERAWGGNKSWVGNKATKYKRRAGRIGLRELAGCPDLRLHDLRHGVGTYAGSAGLNAFVVRDLLGHKTLAMTGRYVSKHADPLRVAADQVSNQIAALLEGRTGEVVPITKQR